MTLSCRVGRQPKQIDTFLNDSDVDVVLFLRYDLLDVMIAGKLARGRTWEPPT